MSSRYQIVVRKGTPYLRKRPFTTDNPTLRQQIQQGRFAKVAYDQFDKATGYKDGLPIVAATIQEETKGKRQPPSKRILEITPLQYAELLIQVDDLRRRGVRTDLITILRDRNIRIKPLQIPEVKEVPTPR
jgi:hypothetical protein